jgi:60 kDa SS-A/Ro ribonucleoprotein
VKYQNRSGFSHRDFLRLAHPVAEGAERLALYAWIVRAEAPKREAGLGVPGLTPRVAAAAMAMTHVAVEPSVRAMAFSNRFVPLAIAKGDRLADVVKRTDDLPFDDGLRAADALRSREGFGDRHVRRLRGQRNVGRLGPPDQALRAYRARTGISAKLVVVGMTSTGFTIADPNDAGMLDVVGFDASAPGLIARFARPDLRAT